MRHEVHFTKKDILVLFGCVLFLLMTIGAIGSSGRRKAQFDGIQEGLPIDV